MKIYIGGDHRGFEMKSKLIEWLKSEKHEIEDCGNTSFDPADDYVDFANNVAQRVVNDKASFGVVICGSGIGVCAAANRHKGVICGLGFDTDQIKHARENDHINILSLPSDYVNLEKAKQLIKAFLESEPILKEKYLRRAKKLDSLY